MPLAGFGGHHSFDPFVTLGFVAGVTTTLRLLTFLIVAPYRNPFLTAKAAATLDVVSGGRLVLGVGAGYMHEEFPHWASTIASATASSTKQST